VQAGAEPGGPLKFTSLFLLLALLTLGFTAPAWADTIAITNPSFETHAPFGCTGCGTWNVGPIHGWTITGGRAGSWLPDSSAFPSVPDGNIIAFSNGATLSQTLSASIAPYTTYSLSVDVGHRLDGTDGYPAGYTIELLAGGMLLRSISGFSGDIPKGTFQDVSFNFTSGATGSGNLAIELISGGIQSDFDNVRLTAAQASEPGSLALLITGLGLALFLFRRR